MPWLQIIRHRHDRKRLCVRRQAIAKLDEHSGLRAGEPFDVVEVILGAHETVNDGPNNSCVCAIAAHPFLPLVAREPQSLGGVQMDPHLVQERLDLGRALAEAFRHKDARKLYWAVTVGVPERSSGTIDLPLAKLAGARGERVAADEEEGLRAVTRWRVVERAGREAAWLALMPETGRTHQLRVHCAALGAPILGDFKYGGREAALPGGTEKPKLHLHARAIRMPHPKGGAIDVEAPLPGHMRETFAFLGFSMDASGDADLRD